MKTPSALTLVIYAAIFASGAALSLILSPLLAGINATLNWPDIVSASVAASAFLLALFTYRNWIKQKVKEDAYTTTKSYITTLVSIEEVMIEMRRKFDEIIPRPGNLALSEEYTKNEILTLKRKHSELITLTTKLMHVHDELAFWGASLTSESDHTTTLKGLDRYLRNSDLLLNSMININFHYHPDESLHQHDLSTLKNTQELFLIFKQRKTKKMSTYFRY
ncbi:hypothetical protein [Pseudomonas xanthosomatis]|uniref:hypothetical protein n=1 Tax=Pseudomonas xanthosomatis TaxID=2842356 RepID=UPI003516EAAA